MDDMRRSSLRELCIDREAFETPRWAIESVLDVEMVSPEVLDPCAGTGQIGSVLRAEGVPIVAELDIVNWRRILPDGAMRHDEPIAVADFLGVNDMDLSESTVVMNPPFSLAAEFVDRCRALKARKVICFQRFAWRESGSRREWWETHPPARIWLCGARASCWRFDLAVCQHDEGFEQCPNRRRRGKRINETLGCFHCLGNVPTAHAWFVWERGHKGAELQSAIFPRSSL